MSTLANAAAQAAPDDEFFVQLRSGVSKSTEVKTAADYFTNWKGNAPNRDVMVHEYTHAWNGNFDAAPIR